MNIKYVSREGFTLIELLVVVIIIAILAAVAVPQYKHAVLKSRFSTVMPMAKSIADAQEVYYQGRQMYALSQDDLDVTPVTAENTSVALSTTAEEDKYAYVAAQRSDVPGARYIMYQKYSPMFANTIQCEADENNEDALWLCEKGLNGTEISGSVNTAEGNYRTFLLSGTAGATDKLPTSLTKLKAQLCAGVSEENCVVDEDNETITAYTCGTYGGSTSELRSWLYGSGDDANGCIGTQYDLDGNPAGTRKIKCSNGTTTNADKTACVGTPTSTGSSYEETIEGNMGYSKNCMQIQNNQCTQNLLTNSTYTDNNNTRKEYQISFMCESSNVKADHTCSSYIALTGNQAPWGTERKYNSQGEQTWSIQCTHREPDGTCTSMKEGRLGIFSDNGTQTGYVQVSCTTSHLWDTNPCTEYKLSYNGNAPSGPATCPANRLNFDTFECAPES